MHFILVFTEYNPFDVLFVLYFQGEIFGGIHVGNDSNDAEILMQYLGKCCACGSQGHTTACNNSGLGKSSIPELLSIIKGPWAMIYWQVTLSGKFLVIMIPSDAAWAFSCILSLRFYHVYHL